MKHRFRGGVWPAQRPRRLPNKVTLRVEQLEPRLVLAHIVGTDVGLALATKSLLAEAPILPLAGQGIAAEFGTGETTRTQLNPRQLPGSSLSQFPPSALYRIEPAIVAGDPDGTPSDSPANRIDPNTADSLFAGVGSLRINANGSNYTCTGTAISPIHVLTAAHCLDLDANGSIDADPADVQFNVNIGPGSDSTYEITAGQLYLHPDWTGFENPSANDDIAVVELSSALANNVPIYPLNDVPFDQKVTAFFAGYGRSGDGISGYTTGASYTVKRWGMNDIDYYFVDDEGSGVRETFQFDFDAPDSPDSLGNDVETTLGSGDSGGPSFIEDANGNLKLFGVNTFTTQFESNTPVAPLFGSGGGGMVVAAYVDFINGIIHGDQVVVSETDNSTVVSEDGDSDTYSVVLSSVPSHSVVVDIAGGDQLTVYPTQLTFTTDNWDVPQDVLVQAIDDSVVEGPNVGIISFAASSGDLGYQRVAIDNLSVHIIDNDWSLKTTPYVDLGPSDNVAWDQPRASVELLIDDAGTGSVGPSILNTWLLDTGANTTIAFRSAVEDMREPPYIYQTEGKFVEIGVAGPHEFDISAAYRFDFAGNSGVRNTLLDSRIISDPENDISIFGPFGIVGMPAMNDRATTLDFSGWTTINDDSDLLMRVDFSDEVPPDNGHRFSVPVDKRITFSPDEQVTEGNYSPMWADVPFLTAIPVHNGAAAGGNFIYDSGAQVSVMSTRVAKEIGLDSNGDGLLDENDANFARFETVGGVGGTITAPVFLFDEVRVPTQQGVDMSWTDLQWLVLDIADGLDGVIGFDLMTSGWIEAFAVNGQSGSIMQAQLDFLQWSTSGLGAVHLDLNPEISQVIDPSGPGARIIETGGSTTVSETGVSDTYEILLTQQPTENVTIALTVSSATAPTQLSAVDQANPDNDFMIFTPANWNIPQTVLVSAVNDGTAENFHRSSVRHVSSSADLNYDNVGMPRVITNIIDDDYPGVMIIPSDGATEVVEGGSTDTYQVVLSYPNSQDVKIRMEHKQGQLTAVDAANPLNSFLTFTPDNWDVPQTVLVTATEDNVEEGLHEAYISHFIDTNDTDFTEAFSLQELVTIRELENANVVDRRIFYNGSRFDGRDDGVNVADSVAIAPNPDELVAMGEDPALGKTALLPGQTATFQNYTSYSAGINGIMIDVIGLRRPGALTAGDFVFHVGNDDTPSTWSLAPTPARVDVRLLPDGLTHRITITWPDNAISKQWLQVTMLPNLTTSLLEPEVFYWGNAIGESGDSTTNTRVNATDEIGARNNPHGRFTLATVFDRYDYDRDTRVNATDQIIARNNTTGRFTSLRLITVPATN